MGGTDIYYLGALPSGVSSFTLLGDSTKVVRSLQTLTLKPRHAKCRYFNSHVERTANLDYDKTPKYFAQTFTISDPWPGYTAFVEMCKVPDLVAYLKTTDIVFDFYFNGTKRAFVYRPQDFSVTYNEWNRATQYKSFEVSWNDAEYYNRVLSQVEISDFNGSAYKVRKQLDDAIAAYKKIKNKSEKDARYIAIVQAVAAYNGLCDKVAADKSFKVDVKKYQANISGTGVGDFGLTITIIGIIALATLIYGAVKVISNDIRKTNQYRAAMDTMYNNNKLLLQAAEKAQAGQISQGSFEAIKKQVAGDNKALQDDADRLTKTDPSMLGEAKGLLVIGGVIFLASKLIK